MTFRYHKHKTFTIQLWKRWFVMIKAYSTVWIINIGPLFISIDRPMKPRGPK